MLTKTLSTFGVIPRIASETKTKTSAPRYQRVAVQRTPAKTVASRARSANLVPYLSVVSLAALASLVVLHLFMVNAYTTKGFELKKQEQAIRDLDAQQKSLLAQQAELGSMTKVNDVASAGGYVPVTNEEFLNTSQLTQR